MFAESLGNYQLNIFAVTAVLGVGIDPYFYGFLMDKQLFWPISCICLTKWTFKIIADLDSNILCSVKAVKAVDQQNNKKKNKMEKWAYFTICQKS